ncbi:hypothetical protein Q2589_003262 [Salmonella enterica]|nr:hypothetical protein [Salmonella enterica]ELM5564987.1 hypothetical protein [Salmonella enterica]
MMHKEFEIWMRQRYGNRYDLTRDIEEVYCREIVRRMFDVWRYLRGFDVV